MARYSPPSTVHISFGPGPVTPAVKSLIWANVVMFVAAFFVPSITVYLGLWPAAVVQRLAVWQPLTYMFLHGGFFHILFNMLMLWMFGVELERLWGTRFFLKFYFVSGLGAAATTLLWAVLPLPFADTMYNSLTIGASGAIYGLLMAYALTYPDRPIYMYLLFPIQVKYFVLIMGAIAFLSSISAGGGGIAHAAHLGGLATGYLYLQSRRGGPLVQVRYYLARWRMNRARRKFGVYSGGHKNDWERRIH